MFNTYYQLAADTLSAAEAELKKIRLDLRELRSHLTPRTTDPAIAGMGKWYKAYRMLMKIVRMMESIVKEKRLLLKTHLQQIESVGDPKG